MTKKKAPKTRGVAKKKKPASTKPTQKKKTKLVAVKIKNHRDKKGDHPHVIVEDLADKHVSVGLSTKAKKGKNHPNYKLEVNPLGGNETSYMRRQGTVDKKTNYYGDRHGAMTPKDYAQAKNYAERAKQKVHKKSNDRPNT